MEESTRRTPKMDTRRSVVWQYFADMRKINGTNFVECTLCNKRYSHKGNTTNMFHHLKTNHPAVYTDALMQRRMVAESCGPSAVVPVNVETDFHSIPHPLEVKIEASFVDADQSNIITEDTLNPNDLPEERSQQEVYCERAQDDVVEEEMSSPQPSNFYAKKRKTEDEALYVKVARLSSEVKDVKDRVHRMAGGGDQHFFNSISSEFESMDDDSRDLIKAAIWQIIYKVKCAQKRKSDLGLEDLLK